LLSDDGKLSSIPEVPQTILKACSIGNLVVFIGAGVSRIIGCPSWEELASKVEEDLFEKNIINFQTKKEISNFDPRKRLSICKQLSQNNLDLGQYLKEKQELKEKYNIYGLLSSFNAIYITTNFDQCADEVTKNNSADRVETLEPLNEPSEFISQKQKPGEIIFGKEKLLINHLKQGNLIKLHGSVEEPATLIYTTMHYLDHYQNESRANVLLKHLFGNMTVLFIGYGLEELDILEYIVTRRNTQPKLKQHVLLFPEFSSNANIIKLQTHYFGEMGIELIPYPIEENGYKHLYTVLEGWTKYIKSKPQNYYEKKRIIDEYVK